MGHAGARWDVREAIAADAPAVAAIQVRSWCAGYRGILPDAVLDALTVPAREERWREILATRAAGAFTLVAAEGGGALAGFCSIILPSRDPDAAARTGEVAALYVDPPHWRRGAGRALLEAALARVPGDAMTLWVLAGNTAARDFYAAAGFAPDGAQATHAASGAPEVRLRTSLPRR